MRKQRYLEEYKQQNVPNEGKPNSLVFINHAFLPGTT